MLSFSESQYTRHPTGTQGNFSLLSGEKGESVVKSPLSSQRSLKGEQAGHH